MPVTATAVTVSAARLVCGREQAGRVPSGVVLVRTGKTTLCTIRLTARKGSCVLGAKRLRAGKYKLSGTYAGTASFSPSTSVVAPLTVAK